MLLKLMGRFSPDYTAVVLGCVGLLGLVNWILYARRHYHGPRIELGDQVIHGLEVRVE